MLRFLHYLLGYLLIKISGEDSELLLNNSKNTGVNIWNLRYKNGCIYGNISVKNFITLFYLRHKLKCKIKIVKKHGLYFKVKNYKKRIGLFVGIFIFTLTLFVLSRFVWVINIEGNTNIKSQEIINLCDSLGINEGVSKNKINNKYDAQRLMLAHSEISWCSFNLEGCVLNINISEIERNDKEIRNTPSNVKANIAGKIKKIEAISGDVLIKIGDTVAENDLLVSGIIQNASGVHFVYSDAVIIAETKRVFSAYGHFEQNCLVANGYIKKHITVDFFNIKIPFYLNNIKGECNYQKDVKHLTLFNKKIPIKIATEKYEILEMQNITYSQDTLIENLCNDINEQIDKLEFININEASRELIKTDKGLLLKITYICEENIALQDEIILGKVN